MNFPCPTHIPCVDPNSPIANLSAELADVDTFDGFHTGDPSFPPPLGSNWSKNSCLGVCTSTISQEDADLCAYRNMILCVMSEGGPPGPPPNTGGPVSGPPIIPPPSNPLVLFANDAVSCPVPCSFGGVVSIPVAAGLFLAPNKAAANAIAQSYACRGASRLREVGNQEQCATAQCPGGDPFTATRCTPANTYGECLLDPSPAALAAAQEFYNDAAKGAAQADANEALAQHGCEVCNTAQDGFAACPGDPTKIAHGSVPAGKYCVPAGGSQDQVDAQASQDLYNQTQAGLTALGCACTGHVNTNQTVTFKCDTFVLPVTAAGNLFPAPLNGIVHIAAGQTFDWDAMCLQAYGSHASGVCRLLGQTYTAPEIKLYFPP